MREPADEVHVGQPPGAQSRQEKVARGSAGGNGNYPVHSHVFSTQHSVVSELINSLICLIHF